jgi:lipopolysaccharide/colanic/teichoic acid biosynthesis glycosyltransferase
MKRVIDIIGSALGILILSIPFVVIAFLIFIADGGSPFFLQERVGKYGKPFKMVKFRSMRMNAPQGAQLTVGKDPRITAIGAFIRKYKIDELPQLWNVFVGDMSLVGPRPEVKRYVDLYSDEQRAVLQVKPGITDYASIQYFEESALLAASEHPEKTYIEEIMPAKLKINLAYIESANVWADLKVIGLTFLRIVQ